jgi:hypothetical protein
MPKFLSVVHGEDVSLTKGPIVLKIRSICQLINGPLQCQHAISFDTNTIYAIIEMKENKDNEMTSKIISPI